jgi:DNA polymerase-2
MIETKVFLLTGEWRDLNGKNELRFIGKSGEYGPVEIIINDFKPVFFIERNTPEEIEILNSCLRKSTGLKSFSRENLDALYFFSQRELKIADEELHRLNIATYEADIDPVKRFLMEKKINVQAEISGDSVPKGKLLVFVNPEITPCSASPPDFSSASIDIETGRDGMLYSIGVHLTEKSNEERIVFMLGEVQKNIPAYLHFFKSEKDLLSAFLEWIKVKDPDFIIGWNIVGFDLLFLEKKCGRLNINLDLSRNESKLVLKKRKIGGYFVSIPGRIVIDGPAALRAAFFSFDDYKLETVAQEILGTGKLIAPSRSKVFEIERLFREDKIKLAEYNIKDTELVTAIFSKIGIIDLSVKRAQLSGLFLDQLGFMSAAFDHFYLPRLHKKGYAAPNVKDLESMRHSAGGHVLDPKPGIYQDIILLDFKSLYPTIVRTFKIDPLSRLLSHENPVQTPDGYNFSSTNHILPDFIAGLMEKRAEANRKKDKPLSQAIKILMNSFYGVMGSYNCRFYHPDLPSAITGTGKWLLLECKNYLEQNGYAVIYGDTDSLFVKLKEGETKNAEAEGKRLACELNFYLKDKLTSSFGVESFLEIEFEKHYSKFIITVARKGETGAKKRYAGMRVEDGKEIFEFIGMEFVRSDWTKLAKEFQMELYERIFTDKEIHDWIRGVVNSIRKGELNDKLIYRKRLRKEMSDYTKNVPPQVRAARMLSTGEAVVRYIITKSGPVPVELNPRNIDYQHYIDKQLKPITDSVLGLLGQSFDSIINSDQLSFFDDL